MSNDGTNEETNVQNRCSFTVGIVGHRPDNLAGVDLDLLKGTIHKTLVDIFVLVTTYDCETVFWALSPLAEGVDRIFAEEALALGWQLHCPLPFPINVYEKDFAIGSSLEVGSLERFRRLLLSSTIITELPGDRHNLSAAYGACGRYVLDGCDLLIAVWDGEPGQPGGTAELVSLAHSFGKPLIRIHSESPHQLTCFLGADRAAGLPLLIRAILHLT